MKCPHCGKTITAHRAAALLGARGGRATGPRKARTSEQARKAALASWEARRSRQKRET